MYFPKIPSAIISSSTLTIDRIVTILVKQVNLSRIPSPEGTQDSSQSEEIVSKLLYQRDIPN
jgi:hypothetical protein